MKKHLIRGGIVTLVSLGLLAALMYAPRFLSFGIAVGLILTIIAGIGILDLFGALKLVPLQERKKAKKSEIDAALPPWARGLLGNADVRMLWIGLGFVASGVARMLALGTPYLSFPAVAWVFVFLGAFIVLLAYKKPLRPFDGDLHPGLFVVVASISLLVPTLGSMGLWDPWETHYGEVARRMIERDDWISCFWENEWFYSKPVLIFWLMGLGMALFGVNVYPDSISPHAEWGIRFPVIVIAIMTIVAVYYLVSTIWNKRAGVFASLVLLTMPQFFLISRQAITDLPFVGFMTIAVIFFVLAMIEKPDGALRTWVLPLGKRKGIELSAFHVLVMAFVLCALPQMIYVGTRTPVFEWGTEGQGNVRQSWSVIKILPWWAWGLLFLVPWAMALATFRNERRSRPIFYAFFYLFAALSTMAKGLGGILLPGMFIFLFILITRRWRMLKEMDLLRGIVLYLTTGYPWFVAMYLRHGMAFINRLLIHDHLDRLVQGVHGDTGTFGYFLEQAAYASYPWIALIPPALFLWIFYKNRGEDAESAVQRELRLFVSFWCVSIFALLSLMITKFHHYIFPVMPPAAIMVGLFADDVLRGRVPAARAVFLAALTGLAFVGRDLAIVPASGLPGYAKLVHLYIYKYSRPWPPGPEWDFHVAYTVFAVIGVAIVLLALWDRLRKPALYAFFVFAFAFAFWASNSYMVRTAQHWTQRQLIDSYYRMRNSPNERLVAWQMNWKGENFYTGNRVVVYVSLNNTAFLKWVEEHRGERHFITTEKERWGSLKRILGDAGGTLTIIDDSCNKYLIGSVQL